MKFFKILMICGLLAGCASIKKKEKPVYSKSNDYFSRWIDEFKKDYFTVLGTSIDKLKTFINFESPDKFLRKQEGNKITVWNAQCRIYDDYDEKEIWINQELWGRYNDNKRKTVIYHELGHCELGREAHDNTIINGRKASIMHSNISGILTDNKDLNRIYIHELFTGDKSGWSVMKK